MTIHFACVAIFAYKSDLKVNKSVSVIENRLNSRTTSIQSYKTHVNPELASQVPFLQSSSLHVKRIKKLWKPIVAIMHHFQRASLRIGILYVCLLAEISLAAWVSDLSPSTDCKALLAQKADERAKNPDLVRHFANNKLWIQKRRVKMCDFLYKSLSI